jgi:transposase
MKPIYRRCAGLDIHKKTVSACIRIRRAGSKEVQIEEAVFGTFTADLERLAKWLREHKVRHVAMESTGVYWMPVWNVLEGTRHRFELMLVNPATVRALRGCKTDRIDARRIAEYLQYGLLHGSFVPPRPIRELRDLTRARVQLQHDRNRVINRIARLLEGANIKLASVVSNIVGKTGQAILQAIAGGSRRPERLAELACGSLRARKQELATALDGRYSEHFRWLLGRLLAELDRLDANVAELEARISEQMLPYDDMVRRLCTIPGVDRVTAWSLIAELGVDMTQFPDDAHAASWAGLCPGNEESAGKRFSGRTRKGNRYLRRILVQNAWAVAHRKDCFLTALFYRIAARKGMKKAAVAVAHRILIIAWHILRDGTEYREYGGDYYDRQRPERTAARLARRIERMGYEVVLSSRPAVTPADAPAAKGKRGRPCKCAERGIACVHDGSGRTSDSPPPASALGLSRRSRRSPAPAGPATCTRCAAWGIPCIHARPRAPKPNHDFPSSPADSLT